MSEHLKLQIAVLIKNTISLTLWAVLAITFNKWWIALFSMLFLTFVKKENNKEYQMKRNKYNISHIKLLKMIKKGKLKEGAKIYASDFVAPLFYENGTLYFYNCYDERKSLTFKDFIENIKYAKFKIGDRK